MFFPYGCILPAPMTTRPETRRIGLRRLTGEQLHHRRMPRMSPALVDLTLLFDGMDKEISGLFDRTKEAFLDSDEEKARACWALPWSMASSPFSKLSSATRTSMPILPLGPG